MKRYSELNTAELVAANLTGEYNGMTIDTDIALSNLKNLEPSLASKITEHKNAYENVTVMGPVKWKNEEYNQCVDEYVQYVNHLRDLMEKLKKAIV